MHARPAIQAPEVGQAISQASKDAITESALGLLEEQVQARIVHYKAELETNPELDAITAQVVAQLRQMQEQMGASSSKTPSDRAALAAQQERTLTNLLARLFPDGAPTLVVERAVKSVLRNLAKVYFQSELHERTRGADGAVKVIQHGEQAMFYLLTRYHHRMKNELEHFDYISDEIRERSYEVLSKLTKDMQDAFLSRRSSELKRIVGIFNNVLLELCTKVLPTIAAPLAHEVIGQAGTADGKAFGYKITKDAFPRFRVAFERRLMTRLVSFVEDQLVTRLADTAGPARDETIKFITDPAIFSMICGQLSECVYEFLCNEGFLDLPPEWIESHGKSPAR